MLPEQIPLLKRLLYERPTCVVDLGAGLGEHAQFFLAHDAPRVVAVDHVQTAELAGLIAESRNRCAFVHSDLATLPFDDMSVPAIWASHCLEHMNDPLAVLREWRRALSPRGWLAVLVPPYKSDVVGRHVFTGWNVGQLMLTLLRAGFDIRDGAYARTEYNVFALVRRSEQPPAFLPNDEILYRYHHLFPPRIEEEIERRRFTNAFGEVAGRFEGEIARLGPWPEDG